MPILQWLFRTPSNTSSRSRKEQCNITEEESDQEEESCKEVARYDKSAAKERKTLTILLNRDESEACFYKTLQLKRLRFENLAKEIYHTRNLNFMKMGSKNNSAVSVGCKVLPICDIATLGSMQLDRDVQKQKKAVSKMKELIRWAAAANKSGRAGIKGWKVTYFKNKTKEAQDDESSNSSRISFRWDVGSCSTSSVFSPLSIASAPSRFHEHKAISDTMVTLPSSTSNSLENLREEEEGGGGGGGCRGAQWITSDSDFVVLEL